MGPETLEKEESPDPALTGQREGERPAVVGCLVPLWLTEGGLEKEEEWGSVQNQQGGCFASAEG